MNTSMLLQNDMNIVKRYQAMVQRINQIDHEWVSVPFHWDAAQLAHVRSIAETYQAICEQEINWRLEQYRLFDTDAREADQPDHAEMWRTQANNYWRELSEWRDEAMYARLLVQRVERGVQIYVAYQVRQAKEHAMYMERVGLA